MRLFWFWASLCSLFINQIAVGADGPAKPRRVKDEVPNVWTRPYEQAIRNERVTFNKRSNVEKIVGGSLAFGLGTYGYYNDSNRQIAGKLIYSATQSGGILAISSGIVGLSSTSPLIALDDEFQCKGRLSFDEYKRVVVESTKSAELASIQKTAISAGLLALLYSYNGYLERDGNLVLRNTFGFLAFNFTLFSSVSFYRWYTFGDELPDPSQGKLTASIDSLNSLSLKYYF